MSHSFRISQCLHFFCFYKLLKQQHFIGENNIWCYTMEIWGLQSLFFFLKRPGEAQISVVLICVSWQLSVLHNYRPKMTFSTQKSVPGKCITQFKEGPRTGLWHNDFLFVLVRQSSQMVKSVGFISCCLSAKVIRPISNSIGARWGTSWHKSPVQCRATYCMLPHILYTHTEGKF